MTNTKKNQSSTSLGRQAAAQGAVPLPKHKREKDNRRWAMVTYYATFMFTVENIYDGPNVFRAGKAYKLETLRPHEVIAPDILGTGDLLDAACLDIKERFGDPLSKSYTYKYTVVLGNPKVVSYKMLSVAEEKEVRHA